MIQGSNHSSGKEILPSPICPEQLRGPSSLIFNGYRGYVPRVKWLGREADHSVPLNGEVKNEWRYTSTALYAVLLWTGRTFKALLLLYVPIKRSNKRHFFCVPYDSYSNQQLFCYTHFTDWAF